MGRGTKYVSLLTHHWLKDILNWNFKCLSLCHFWALRAVAVYFWTLRAGPETLLGKHNPCGEPHSQSHHFLGLSQNIFDLFPNTLKHSEPDLKLFGALRASADIFWEPSETRALRTGAATFWDSKRQSPQFFWILKEKRTFREGTFREPHVYMQLFR